MLALTLDETHDERAPLLEVDVEVASVGVDVVAAFMLAEDDLLLHRAGRNFEQRDLCEANLNQVAEARLLDEQQVKHLLVKVSVTAAP